MTTAVQPTEEQRQQVAMITTILQSKSHYEVLSLPFSASPEDIRKSYLRSSRYVHPDKCQHELAKQAFHRLATAYETLSNPKSRRIYDLGGDDLLGGSSSNSQRQSWQACINEVFAEFMNSNYEPVMSALEMLNKQSPGGIGLDRDAVRLALSHVRQFIMAGQIRYDLIQSELLELKQMRSGKRLSLFNVIGRMRYSLRITRLVLVVIRKSIAGPADAETKTDDDSNNNRNDNSDNEKPKPGRPPADGRGKENFESSVLAAAPDYSRSVTCDCLDGAISIIQRTDDGLQALEVFSIKRWFWQ